MELSEVSIRPTLAFRRTKEKPDTPSKEKETRLVRAVRLSREVLLVLNKTDDLSNNLKEALDDLKGMLQDYIEEAEPGPDDEDKPEVRTHEKKGKDRLISPVDRDARWGAKSVRLKGNRY